MSDLVERLEGYRFGTTINNPHVNCRAVALFDIEEAAARIRELEALLKPFADFAANARWAPNDLIITEGTGMARRQLTIGNCRAALQALGGGNG